MQEIKKMKIGFIGLGKMGSNMVLNLLDNKHKIVVYNRSPEPTKKISKTTYNHASGRAM